jgi:hypothetical protein
MRQADLLGFGLSFDKTQGRLAEGFVLAKTQGGRRPAAGFGLDTT